MKKTNVLILYSDQHHAGSLGCCGNPYVKTPNLDRLAEEGVLLERAYTQNPICTPSRMSFLSGLYPHNLGYYGLMGEAPENIPTLFTYFKKAGYRTGAAGKTHTPCGWISKDLDFLADAYGYEIPRLRCQDRFAEGVQGIALNEYSLDLAKEGLLDQRDDKIYPEWFSLHRHDAGQGLDGSYSSLDEEHTAEAWTAKKTIEFLEEHIRKEKNDERPFFFWMTVPRPHQTYRPAKKFWDMYEDPIPLPENADDRMEGRHPAAAAKKAYFKESTEWMSFEPKTYEAARQRVLRAYYANVTQADDAFGRVLDYLDEKGLRENTLVLYLSDHGEFAGEHGMIEKAPGIAFHCVTHVPAIISFPKLLPQNCRRQGLAESVDWFSTLCEICDIDLPDHVFSKSLLPLLQRGEEVNAYAFTENAFSKTIHSPDYKLTVYLDEANQGRRFGELYDLKNDPGEMKNLFFEEDRKVLVHELSYELLLWLIRTSRVKTINPSVLSASGLDGDWDIGGEFYADDGFVKNSFIEDMIKRGSLNYF